MALSTGKVPRSPVVTDQTTVSKPPRVSCTVANPPQNSKNFTIQGFGLSRHSRLYRVPRLSPHGDSLWHVCRRPVSYIISWEQPVICRTRTHRTGSKEGTGHSSESSDLSREQSNDYQAQHAISHPLIISSNQGLAEACKYAYNDAKFVNERARNDIVLLSRGILRLDARARQDVAILSSEFLKLDARAREDTEKIDHNVKKKAERLHHIATILKDKAKSRLKTAADRHWSDGALEADLRRADLHAKRRAMEDTLMALEFVKNIHDLMVRKMYKLPLRRENGPTSSNIMLEKNGKTQNVFRGEVSNDRILAIQEAYRSMASALSEADGIDYTDPEELELLVTTLIDLDAMDGKSSVSLLAECCNSPDVNTRQALANALAAAPSMWTLGNAGMGALQRLAEDSNPAVAAAATRAINELKKEWEIEEGDSLRFMMNQPMKPESAFEDDDEDVDKTS